MKSFYLFLIFLSLNNCYDNLKLNSFLQMKDVKEDSKIINKEDRIDGRYRIMVLFIIFCGKN